MIKTSVDMSSPSDDSDERRNAGWVILILISRECQSGRA
jgi:hypothetical protein